MKCVIQKALGNANAARISQLNGRSGDKLEVAPSPLQELIQYRKIYHNWHNHKTCFSSVNTDGATVIQFTRHGKFCTAVHQWPFSSGKLASTWSEMNNVQHVHIDSKGKWGSYNYRGHVLAILCLQRLKLTICLIFKEVNWWNFSGQGIDKT